MRLAGRLAGVALLVVAAGIAGFAMRNPEPAVVHGSAPAQTTIVDKGVETDGLPEFSLVPLRSPLKLLATPGKIPAESALVPRGTSLSRVERIPPAAGIPTQIVVTWEKGEFPDLTTGLLLWEKAAAGSSREAWKVVFGIQEVELGCRHFYSSSDRHFRRRFLQFYCVEPDGIVVGPPRREWVEGLFCGTPDWIRFRLQDLTGDGHQDVFVSEGGCGSAGTTLRRVLASSPTGTKQVFWEVDSDTGMRLVEGSIHVGSNVYREGDSHCCPSFIRRYVLVWNGDRFVRTESRLIRAPGSE